jgi:hypothetical protein
MVGIMAVAATEMMLLLAAELKVMLLHDSSWGVRNSKQATSCGAHRPRADSLATSAKVASEIWLGKHLN